MKKARYIIGFSHKFGSEKSETHIFHPRNRTTFCGYQPDGAIHTVSEDVSPGSVNKLVECRACQEFKDDDYCVRCGSKSNTNVRVRIVPRVEKHSYPPEGALCKPCRDTMRGGWKYLKRKA